MSRKVFEKPCKFCGARIAIAKRAVGDGYDALDLDQVPEERRGTNDGQRVVVGGFAWSLDELVDQTEVPLIRNDALEGHDFDWRTKHFCPRVTVDSKAAVA